MVDRVAEVFAGGGECCDRGVLVVGWADAVTGEGVLEGELVG